MCTWCQGCGNYSCRNRSGCGCCGSCSNANVGCANLRNVNVSCGVQSTSNANSSCGCGSCRRYVSFPVSGTAYVPTSAIYFCPNTLGTAQTGTSTSSGNSCGNGSSTNCCGFGRCGGAAAISSFYEDYYARQYGLNDN